MDYMFALQLMEFIYICLSIITLFITRINLLIINEARNEEYLTIFLIKCKQIHLYIFVVYTIAQ